MRIKTAARRIWRTMSLRAARIPGIGTAVDIVLLVTGACLTGAIVGVECERMYNSPLNSQLQPLGENREDGERRLVKASWYGNEFHGRLTASGEPFDMYTLTCAHRDYPFGTQLRVSNPRTGNSCDCIVNDRGPFIAERELDLSFAAAMHVDLLEAGVAEVYIETLDGRPVSTAKLMTSWLQ